MSFACDITMQGGSMPQDSIKRLSKAVNKVASGKTLQQQQPIISRKFKSAIDRNASKAGVLDDVSKYFYVNVRNGQVIIGNTAPLLINRYEYGWEDDVSQEYYGGWEDALDDDEYLADYQSLMSPRYYLRPAIEEIHGFLVNLVREQVWKEYEKEGSLVQPYYEWHAELSEYSNYLNKYNGVL